MTTQSPDFKNATFDELFAVLEDLLKRIADTEDPEIRRKRAQVRAEMIAFQSNPPTLTRPSTQPPLAGPKNIRVEVAGYWGQQALIAFAGAAMALSVFRDTS